MNPILRRPEPALSRHYYWYFKGHLCSVIRGKVNGTVEIPEDVSKPLLHFDHCGNQLRWSKYYNNCPHRQQSPAGQLSIPINVRGFFSLKSDRYLKSAE